MTGRSLFRLGALVAVLMCGGCQATEKANSERPASSTGSDEIDSTPTKLDGTESHEFEQDDLDRAEGASDAVKDYCAGAVSEAQRLGCESHVTEVP